MQAWLLIQQVISTLSQSIPRLGPPCFLTEVCMSMIKSGLACVDYVELFRYIELCIFCVVWFCLLVLQPSDWLGRLYSLDIFRANGIPLQRPDEELFIVMVYCICMYSQHVTLSTFSLSSFFNCNISKAQYSLFVLKVPVNPINRSINLSQSPARVVKALAAGLEP